MLFSIHKLQAYFLKITSGRWPRFTSMLFCKRVWKFPYTRLRRSTAATSSTMACLSSWIVMMRLQNTRSFRNPHRKKSGTVRSGDRAGQAVSPKREITVPNISRTTAILFRTIWNGVLSSTFPIPANHDKLSRRRNIQIRNVSVGSAPPCMSHSIVLLYVRCMQLFSCKICGSHTTVTEIYHCVTVQVAPDITIDHYAFVFKVKQSKNSAWSWRQNALWSFETLGTAPPMPHSVFEQTNKWQRGRG